MRLWPAWTKPLDALPGTSTPRSPTSGHASHELRTPLNAAFLGLKCVIDGLEGCEEEADKERFETLTDVSHSCLTTLDILNDLLCFDKVR